VENSCAEEQLADEISHNPEIFNFGSKDFSVNELKKIKPSIVERRHYLEVYQTKIVARDHNFRNLNTFYPITFYKSLRPGPAKKPFVLIIPSIMGVTPIEKNTAKHFASIGYHSAIIDLSDNANYLDRPIRNLDDLLIRDIRGARMLISYAEKLPFVNKNNLGLIGTSLGGIKASILMGVEPRIRAGVIVVGGGGFSDIWYQTKGDETVAYKQHRMKEEGIDTLEEFRDIMKKYSKTDPIKYAQNRDPKDLFMILANKDTVVPTSQQHVLWQAFGQPQKEIVNGGHMTGSLSVLWKYNTITNFFQNRFTEHNNATCNVLIEKVFQSY